MTFIFKAGHSEGTLGHFSNLLCILWPIMLAIIISAGYAGFIIWLLVRLLRLFLPSIGNFMLNIQGYELSKGRYESALKIQDSKAYSSI